MRELLSIMLSILAIICNILAFILIRCNRWDMGTFFMAQTVLLHILATKGA